MSEHGGVMVMGRECDKEDGTELMWSRRRQKKRVFLSMYNEYIELCASVCIAQLYLFLRRQIGSLGWTCLAGETEAESVARPLVAIATRRQAIIVFTGRI